VPPTVAYAPTSKGQSVAYLAVGEGPVAVMLVPALVAQVELLFEEPAIVGMVQHLTTELRLLTYDRLGTGLSDRVGDPSDLALDEVSRDITAVLDHAGVERVVLLAWSWGGPTAIRFAADHPDRTAGLVLLSSLARNAAGDGYPYGRPEEDLERLATDLEADWGGPEFVRHMPDSMAAVPSFVDWAARCARHTMPPGAVAGIVRAMGRHDARADLGRVQAPTLVVHWGGDPFFDVGHSRYLAREIEAATLHELDRTGQLSLVEQAEVMGLVLEFARRLMTGDGEGDGHERRLPSTRPSTTGWAGLTATEREVARLVATGMSNKQIALARHISRYTVDAHLRRIFHKMEVVNRTELTSRMVSERLAPPHSPGQSDWRQWDQRAM
jgi:pimeloyl-ACP methyl ester carboxylesterase/DNA-binding CsgD family transcriptional regulator